MSIINRKQDTFNPSFYSELKKAEETHFWFKVRRKWISQDISRFIPPPANLLEVGCGTGNVGSYLARKGYRVTGCELFQEASEFSWPGFQRVLADANCLPFKDNSFDVVGLFDVIEHFEHDRIPLIEAIRVVKKEGIIAITVPAQEELWSSFDELSCHKRRYSKDKLNQLLIDLKLNILSVDYIFMSLYLPMLYTRRKCKENEDQFKVNRFANIFLKKLFNVERLISKAVPLPIGTSLIAIVQKGQAGK